jgi:hypothetical protein
MEDLRNGLCPICRHNRVIEAEPAVIAAVGETLARSPLAAAPFFEGGERPMWSGLAAAYICQRCGYTQWFTTYPAEIPIGAEYKTRLIEGPPVDQTPYR